jgi:hypothetical protein
VIFSPRCNREWKTTLFQDLRRQSKPIPASELEPLVAQLDDDDFKVREKASAGLKRYGERAQGYLDNALSRPLSSEARRRIASILDTDNKAKQALECVLALEYFETHDAPTNGELLQVLAEGSPDAWLTQQAKEKLAKWRKAHELPASEQPLLLPTD